jgi:hypothetical protein
MGWKEAVVAALHRFCKRHDTHVIDRSVFLTEELHNMVTQAGSTGRTPAQTVSRILQELRDAGLVEFLTDGRYLLLDAPLSVETEDLPNDAIDFAIRHGKLRVGEMVAEDQVILARRRRGQSRIRDLALDNYFQRCAFCDVQDRCFLRAAHIARWADDAENRANLHNVISMCLIHDALFEHGYFTLADNRTILVRKPNSAVMEIVLNNYTVFRPPKSFPPSATFLQKHRARIGFDWDTFRPL